MFVVDGVDLSDKVKKSIDWINNHSIKGEGIAVCSKTNPLVSYPEVTGYYIPTLFKYHLNTTALAYANYLISIQNPNGSWNEPSGKYEYTFDTGMILKGLIAIIEEGLDTNGVYLNSAKRAACWIMSMQRPDGSIATPDYSMWGLPYGKTIPESIHIYFLESFVKLADITKDDQYLNFVQRAKAFYLAKIDLCDFNILSHFNAYIIEGLIDIGEIKKATRAMELISLHQRFDGSVSAYSFVDFVCSTGLLQYAICWFKLGYFERGQKALLFVSNLQNQSGGWYGSYKVSRDIPNYYPSSEISWAVKYYLDAVYYGNDYMKFINSKDTSSFEEIESNTVANIAIELIKEKIESFKNKGVNSIYLYGAGDICLNLIPILEKESINIMGIFDKSAESKDFYINSYKVETFSSEKIKKDSVVLISSLGSKYKIRRFLLNESKRCSLNLQIEILKKKKDDYLKIYNKLKDSYIESIHSDSNKNIVKNNLLLSNLAISPLIKGGFKNEAFLLVDSVKNIQTQEGYWLDHSETSKISPINTISSIASLYQLYISQAFDSKEVEKSLSNSIVFLDRYIENNSFDYFFENSVKESFVTELFGLDSKYFQEKFERFYLVSLIYKCVLSNKFFTSSFNNKYFEYLTVLSDDIEKIITDHNFNHELCSIYYPFLVQSFIDIGKIDLATRLLNLARINLVRGFNAYLVLIISIMYYRLGNINKGNDLCLIFLNNSNKIDSSSIFTIFPVFLDMLYYRAFAINDSSCEAVPCILDKDVRYIALKNELLRSPVSSFLDLGCGKMRYVKNLLKDESFSNIDFHAVDFSKKIMLDAPNNVKQNEGTILNIPYRCDSFDFVFLAESLEHSVDIDLALTEINRVLKHLGRILIIDKDSSSEGDDFRVDFEQWFDSKQLCKKLEQHGFNLVDTFLAPTERSPEFIFRVWIAEKI